MTATDLANRLLRLYAAIDAVVEPDLSQFAPKVMEEQDDGVLIIQDFGGGLNSPQIENALIQLVHGIANLRDNVARWAEQNGVRFDRVAFVQACDALGLVHDLSNVEKHGYPLKKPWSGRSPKLIDVTRSLRLTTGSAGEVSVVTFRGGKPEHSGSGKADVVITARVVDSDSGEYIGDAAKICDAALRHWESWLSTYDLS